ncbi:MBL fold metallo-hydrolase [Candidatus Chordibacter forsetii]|uniref:MBL fold metallo-hydrolase n=1 Tax=Candidatus Chordibacter forsetii TaxID=3381758 RepID=UPI0023249664|nr:MBL fold metallo-hydrolase [Opitutales bacterium]MDB3958243.1 MBL fold metallo-hydrolase [Opitutales bacterium]
MDKLIVKKLELGPIGTNAFLLWENKGSEAILIDAPPNCGEEISKVLKENDLTLSQIWLTHGHWDHMAGVKEVLSPGIKVIGHLADELMFNNPAVMSTFSIPGIDLQPVEITQWVEDGDQLDLWGRTTYVFHCPGHCPGNVAFYLKSEKICFVGDVIFAGSIGRTDLPGGDFASLEASIRNRIYTLPIDTELAVGHGPNTTVGDEIRENPYVRPL